MSPEPKILIDHSRDLERELATANARIANLLDAGNELEAAAGKQGTWPGSRLDQAINAWNSLT
jgi:hypothetical protein